MRPCGARSGAAQQTTLPHLHWRTLDTRYFRFFSRTTPHPGRWRRVAHRRRTRCRCGARRQRAARERVAVIVEDPSNVQRFALRSSIIRSSFSDRPSRSRVAGGQWIMERSALDSRVCAHRASHARISQSWHTAPHESPAANARPGRAALAAMGSRGLRHLRRRSHRSRHRAPARRVAPSGAATMGHRGTAADLCRSGWLLHFEGGDMAYLAGSAFLEWLAVRNGTRASVISGDE